LLFQTKVPEMTKTGFEASVINKNPRMVKLTLKKEDTVRYGIHRVCFSTARFNSGDDVSEDWIITSTGKHLVIWNFAKVKRGIYDDYFVREIEDQVVDEQFRFGKSDTAILATPKAIKGQRRRLSKH